MATAIDFSRLGMINDIHQLNVISHNLANANTAGYKRDIPVTRDFKQVLSEEVAPLVSLFQATQNRSLPRIEPSTDFSPGVFHYTGNPLDVAIEGDAFFELEGSQGVRYSRGGTFSIDASGRLTNGRDFIVSGEEGEVLLQGGEITIDRDGTVHEDGNYAGRLKLVRFASPASLETGGGGMMIAPNGLVAEPATEFGVRQGYRESSNVKVIDEMVRMMSTMRHFETTSRVIKGYDEMVGTAISTIAEF